MVSRDDKLVPYLIDIKERLARVEEHIKTQNGNVARNIKKIEENCKNITDLKIEQKGLTIRVAGITGIIFFLASFLVNIILKYI